jgi:hypothetical protein
MSGYSFYCSKCKFDHAGECVVDVDAPPPGRIDVDSIRELVKALEAGGYNAAPTKLHQCQRDGLCGVPGCDPTVSQLPTCQVLSCEVRGEVMYMTVLYKLPTPLTFVPITFHHLDFEQ